MLQGHLICCCPRSEVSHFFKEEWLHWVFTASVVVITFQWTELGNICSVFKIKCIMIMLILLVQIQDSQVFIYLFYLKSRSSLSFIRNSNSQGHQVDRIKLSQIASYIILYIAQSNSTKDHNQQHNCQKQLKKCFPLEVLAIAVRQNKKIKRHPDWKGISETLVFSDDMVLCIENPKDHQKTIRSIIHDFSEVIWLPSSSNHKVL